VADLFTLPAASTQGEKQTKNNEKQKKSAENKTKPGRGRKSYVKKVGKCKHC